MAKKYRKKTRGKKQVRGKRANKKLLAIIGASIACVLIGLGGLFLFVEYRSAGRNVSAGDSLFAEERFNEAKKQYGRAVTKEPNNLEYINKLQKSISHITPSTIDEARASYDEYVSTLMHKARYSPSDIDVQLELVNEMYNAAYSTSSNQYWHRLFDSTQLSLDRIHPDDPRRHELLLYRGLSALHNEDVNLTETYDENGNAMFPGENDIKEVLVVDPGNALAWATLAHGRMAIYYRMLNEGRTQQAARNKIFADETMEKALAVAGDSFEVNMTFLREMLLRQNVLLQAYLQNPESVSESELEFASEEVDKTIVALIDSFHVEEDAHRITELVSLLISSGESGKQHAIELLKEIVKVRTTDATRIHMLATLLHDENEFEEAIELANVALDVPQQKTGLLSIEQFVVRPAAVSILIQSAIGLANASESDEEHAGYISQAKEYRSVLADLLSNNERHPSLLHADGLIALSLKEYRKAAGLLEEYIALTPNPRASILRDAAFALEETGARGIAIERLGQAIRESPTTLSNYVIKARLECANSDYLAASQTLSGLSPDAKARPDVSDLLDVIAMNTDDSGIQVTDQILLQLKSIDGFINSSSYDEAMALTESLLEEHPEDWRIYATQSNIYVAQGEIDKGVSVLKESLKLNPESDVLKQRILLLESDSPIDAFVTYIEGQGLEENDRFSLIAINCFELANKKASDAKRYEMLGLVAEANKARELAVQASEKSDEYQELLTQAGGDLSAIYILQFETALNNQDLDEATAALELLRGANYDQMFFDSGKIRLQLAKASIAKRNKEEALHQHEAGIALDLALAMTRESPFDDTGWQLLGSVYSALGMNTEAEDAFEEAYRIDPLNMQNTQLYLMALSKFGNDPQRFLRTARTAKEQFPLVPSFHEMWLEIEAQHGDLGEVINARKRIYQRDADNAVNSLSLALLLVNHNPSFEYIYDENNNKKYSMRAWNQLDSQQRQSEIAELQEEWNNLVTEILDNTVDAQHANARLTHIHASIARDLGQLDRASEIWDAFLSNEVEKETYAESVIAAADFLQKANRVEQAVTLLETSLSNQPDNAEIQAALGSLFFIIGRYEEAVQHLELATTQIDSDAVLSKLIESYVYSGQFAKAEEAIAKLQTSNDVYGRAMLSALISRVKSDQLLAQGDLQNARIELKKYRNSLREAINSNRTNPVPYIHLCKTLLNEYRLTQETALLEEAIQVSDEGEQQEANSEDFAVVRTDVLQADGQIHRAIVRLSSFLSENPEANIVRQRLIEAYLDTEESDKAIQVARGGIDNDPSDPVWYQRLGDLHIRSQDDVTSAVKMYLEAIQRDPTVSKLLRLNEVTRTDQILPNRQILVMTQGVLSRSHPIIGSIEAKALNNLDRRRDALLAMTKSWHAFQSAIQNGWITPNANANWFLDLAELFRDNPEEGETFFLSLNESPTMHEQVGLATYYHAIGDEYKEKAIQILREIVPQVAIGSSERARALMLLGGFLVELKRYEESREVFAQLSEEEDSPLVLNNLAYVVGVYLDQPDKGIKIAKEAAKAAPRVTSIIDTVAKLHLMLNEHQKAAETYEYLLQVDPAHTGAMTNLAIIYADELQDFDRAIVYAERARSQNPRSPEVLDALGWSYYRAGREAKGEEFLQLSIKRGDTVGAYLHIAQVLMDKGKYEKALGELRIAEELAQDRHSRKSIEALKDDIRKKQSESGS